MFARSEPRGAVCTCSPGSAQHALAQLFPHKIVVKNIYIYIYILNYDLIEIVVNKNLHFTKKICILLKTVFIIFEKCLNGVF